MSKLKPPSDLTPAARREWLAFAGEFEIDADAALILREYCIAGERLELARESLKHDGLMLDNPTRLNPAAGAAKDAQSIRLRCLRQLGLPLPEDKTRRESDETPRSRRGRKPAPREPWREP